MAQHLWTNFWWHSLMGPRFGIFVCLSFCFLFFVFCFMSLCFCFVCLFFISLSLCFFVSLHLCLSVCLFVCLPSPPSLPHGPPASPLPSPPSFHLSYSVFITGPPAVWGFPYRLNKASCMDRLPCEPCERCIVVICRYSLPEISTRRLRWTAPKGGHV